MDVDTEFFLREGKEREARARAASGLVVWSKDLRTNADQIKRLKVMQKGELQPAQTFYDYVIGQVNELCERLRAHEAEMRAYDDEDGAVVDMALVDELWFNSDVAKELLKSEPEPMQDLLSHITPTCLRYIKSRGTFRRDQLPAFLQRLVESVPEHMVGHVAAGGLLREDEIWEGTFWRDGSGFSIWTAFPEGLIKEWHATPEMFAPPFSGDRKLKQWGDLRGWREIRSGSPGQRVFVDTDDEKRTIDCLVPRQKSHYLKVEHAWPEGTTTGDALTYQSDDEYNSCSKYVDSERPDSEYEREESDDDNEAVIPERPMSEAFISAVKTSGRNAGRLLGYDVCLYTVTLRPED